MRKMKSCTWAAIIVSMLLGTGALTACVQPLITLPSVVQPDTPQAPDPVVPPTTLTVDAAITLNVGAIATLTAVLSPANATDQSLVWTSANPAVASVADDGKVYGHSAGSSVITVRTVDGNLSATSTVTVPANSGLFFADSFESGSLGAWNALRGTAEIISEPSGQKALRFTSDGTQGIALQVADAIGSALPASFYVELMLRLTGDAPGTDKNIGVASNISADKTGFYYGGLNFNNRLQAGVLPGLPKAYQNTSGVPIVKPNGVYRTDPYRVRYEVTNDGSTHRVMLYLNDIPLGKPTGPIPLNPLKYTIPVANKVAAGSGFGIYSSGAPFVIDAVRVGAIDSAAIASSTVFSTFNSLKLATADAAFAPFLQTTFIPYQSTAKLMRIGDADVILTPTATKADGSADTVLITTSSAAVTLSASTLASGTALAVTPSAVGSAKVTIALASDPTNCRTIDFTIQQQLNYTSTDYGTLTTQLSPAIGSTAAYADDVLEMIFDSPPTLASDGVIYLYNATTDALVDTIAFSLEKNTYGSRNLNVGSQLVRSEGNKLVITPHAGKLVAGTTYSVVIPDKVITASLNGKTFTGLVATDKKWTFTVQAANTPAVGAITVAKTGTASFRTVQAALAYASTVAGSADVIIELAAGTYRENLTWNAAKKLTIKAAAGVANTEAVIAFENCEAWNTGTANRPLFYIGSAATAVVLDGITLQNTRSKAANPSASNQAETIYFDNTAGNLVAKNTRFDSRQDTILVKGISWFYNCFVTGDVDFIWGYPQVSLFEKSVIHARVDDRGATNPAYLVQSRAMANAKGFVFLDCDFTVDAARTVDSWFARTGGAGSAASLDSWDSMAIVKSRISPKFSPIGWSDDGGKTVYPKPASANLGWREYGNVVEGGTTPVTTSGRFVGSYVLSDAEYTAGYASRDLILAGSALATIAP